MYLYLYLYLDNVTWYRDIFIAADTAPSARFIGVLECAQLPACR